MSSVLSIDYDYLTLVDYFIAVINYKIQISDFGHYRASTMDKSLNDAPKTEGGHQIEQQMATKQMVTNPDRSKSSCSFPFRSVPFRSVSYHSNPVTGIRLTLDMQTKWR